MAQKDFPDFPTYFPDGVRTHLTHLGWLGLRLFSGRVATASGCPLVTPFHSSKAECNELDRD